MINCMEENKCLILASNSPRRKMLLSLLGIPFSVIPSAFEDEIGQGENPPEIVLANAIGKTMEVARRHPDRWVLGADTVVVHEGTIFGKPSGREEALSMLIVLRGNTHLVFTGVSLVHLASNFSNKNCEVTEVTFRNFCDEEAKAYVSTGEPLDKAGAYGAQGAGSALIDRINGSFTSVVGLPLSTVVIMFEEAGILEISPHGEGLYSLGCNDKREGTWGKFRKT